MLGNPGEVTIFSETCQVGDLDPALFFLLLVPSFFLTKNPPEQQERKKMIAFFWKIVIILSILIEIASNYHGVRPNIHSRGLYTSTVTSSLPATASSLAWGITSGCTGRSRCHGNMMMELAPRLKPRTQNVPGNLFVDEGAIINLLFHHLTWSNSCPMCLILYLISVGLIRLH